MTSTSRHIYFGGSFNPPHIGHTEMITQALARDRAATLHIVPTKQNPLKNGAGASIELIQAWLEDLLDILPGAMFARCQLETIELLSAEEKNFTVSTLGELKQPGEEWILLVGSDSVAQFSQWKDLDELLRQLSEVWVVPRTGADLQENSAPQFKVLAAVHEISSTELRKVPPDNNFLEQKLTPRVLAIWKNILANLSSTGHSA